MRKAATADTRKPHFTTFTDFHDRNKASAAAEAKAAVILNTTAQAQISMVGNSGWPFQKNAFTRRRLSTRISDIAPTARVTAILSSLMVDCVRSRRNDSISIGPTRTAENEDRGRKKKGSHMV